MLVANEACTPTIATMSETSGDDHRPNTVRARPVRMLAVITTAALFGATAVVTLGPALPGDRLAVNTMASCSGPERDACIAAAAVTIAEQDDPASGLQAVRVLLDAEPQIRENCHLVAHEVGKRFHARFGDAAIVTGHSWCSWGYYHGLMQIYDAAEIDQLVPYATRLCAAVGGERTNDCMHGIGHAAYTALGEIPAAAAVCEVLDGGNAETCVDAVIMEAMSKSTDHRIISGFTAKNCLMFTNADVVAGCAQGMTHQIVESGATVDAGCGIFTDRARGNCVNAYGGALAVRYIEGTDTPAYPTMLESCTAESKCAFGFGWSWYAYALSDRDANTACAEHFRDSARRSCLGGVQAASTNETLD